MDRMNPVNAGFRFLLEVAALVVYGMWGYSREGVLPGLVLAILLPLGMMVLWGVFAVKDDPSRSEKTVVPTPGILRLLLEFILLGAAVIMLTDMGRNVLALLLALALILHYLLSFRRVAWLLKQK
jgi:hypothetical protein